MPCRYRFDDGDGDDEDMGNEYVYEVIVLTPLSDLPVDISAAMLQIIGG